jgi:3-dehydroquinate dehydratase-2
VSDLLLINGPNLNLLGSREPKHYGQKTLAQIETDLASEAERLGHRLATYQSNHEGDETTRP